MFVVYKTFSVLFTWDLEYINLFNCSTNKKASSIIYVMLLDDIGFNVDLINPTVSLNVNRLTFWAEGNDINILCIYLSIYLRIKLFLTDIDT